MAKIGFRCKLFPENLNVDGSGSEALLVTLGAVPGAWLRLRLVNHFKPLLPRDHWGTFVVNVSACFSLGLFLGLTERCSPMTGLVLLLAVGFLGSFSTFSTFVVEVLNELRAGQAFLALLLVFASVLIGLFAAAAGYGLGSNG